MASSFDDVVLVPFPFANRSGSKTRPPVIISCVGYDASRRDQIHAGARL